MAQEGRGKRKTTQSSMLPRPGYRNGFQPVVRAVKKTGEEPKGIANAATLGPKTYYAKRSRTAIRGGTTGKGET